jgi:hypothetical protein
MFLFVREGKSEMIMRNIPRKAALIKGRNWQRNMENGREVNN